MAVANFWDTKTDRVMIQKIITVGQYKKIGFGYRTSQEWYLP
jgi:hypothetical protein